MVVSLVNMFILVFLLFGLLAAFDVLDVIESNDYQVLRQSYSEHNNSVFGPLVNIHVNATPTNETVYGWIGRVIHSRTERYPCMCSAVCINIRIFITAARCIYRLKVKYTSILYKSELLPARAFVFPSKPTKQMYDDIGFIVVEGSPGVTFELLPMYLPKTVNRTDKYFNWFANHTWEGPYKVVGYAKNMEDALVMDPDVPYRLYELSVKVNIDLCNRIMTADLRNAYHVPCYFYCDSKSHFDKMCKPAYLGTTGAAVVNIKTNKLLGIATWGLRNPLNYSLPVGFSVVHSHSFEENYRCAEKIMKAEQTDESYEPLCKH